MHLAEIEHKKIVIVGFGREGKSTFRYLRQLFPNIPLAVADQNEAIDLANDEYTTVITGKDYLSRLSNYDVIIKSPGVVIRDAVQPQQVISSQTDLFLNEYGSHVIGITGTKGKSTTTELIYHICNQHHNAVLAGNIGIPFFDVVPEIAPQKIIVCELSCHQLEYLSQAPHTAILLNLFEEHLDHYKDFLAYQEAKFNICRMQPSNNDVLIYNADDPLVCNRIEAHQLQRNYYAFSLKNKVERGCFINANNDIVLADENKNEQVVLHIDDTLPLRGEHNLCNIMAATLACYLNGISLDQIISGIYSFRGLPHRMQLIGTFDGITYYDDSISTIPQATIAAVKTLKNVDSLILGGFDRGIDYSALENFLPTTNISNIIFTGNAGKRMYNAMQNAMQNKRLLFADNYEEIMRLAKQFTKKGSICLLSPAAASYDMFRNFEHRGEVFATLAQQTA